MEPGASSHGPGCHMWGPLTSSLSLRTSSLGFQTVEPSVWHDTVDTSCLSKCSPLCWGYKLHLISLQPLLSLFLSLLCKLKQMLPRNSSSVPFSLDQLSLSNLIHTKWSQSPAHLFLSLSYRLPYLATAKTTPPGVLLLEQILVKHHCVPGTGHGCAIDSLSPNQPLSIGCSCPWTTNLKEWHHHLPRNTLFVLKNVTYLIYNGKISGIIGYNFKRQATLCSSVVYKVSQGKKKKPVPEVPYYIRYCSVN